MKILFDQNVPRPLVRYLAQHEVTRSAQLGWAELKNDDLIKAAEDLGFDVLLTADGHLAYQQSLEGGRLAIIVLPSGQWSSIKLRIPAVVQIVGDIQPGTLIQLPKD